MLFRQSVNRSMLFTENMADEFLKIDSTNNVSYFAFSVSRHC